MAVALASALTLHLHLTLALTSGRGRHDKDRLRGTVTTSFFRLRPPFGDPELLLSEFMTLLPN